MTELRIPAEWVLVVLKIALAFLIVVAISGTLKYEHGVPLWLSYGILIWLYIVWRWYGPFVWFEDGAVTVGRKQAADDSEN